MVVFFRSWQRSSQNLAHAHHVAISIQGWSLTSFCSWVHFQHYIPNAVACNVLGWTLHKIAHGIMFDTTHIAYIYCTMKGMMHWRWYMCPKPTSLLARMGWSRLDKWCCHMWSLEVLAKKTHFVHVWVGLTCTRIMPLTFCSFLWKRPLPLHSWYWVIVFILWVCHHVFKILIILIIICLLLI